MCPGMKEYVNVRNKDGEKSSTSKATHFIESQRALFFLERILPRKEDWIFYICVRNGVLLLDHQDLILSAL